MLRDNSGTGVWYTLWIRLRKRARNRVHGEIRSSGGAVEYGWEKREKPNGRRNARDCFSEPVCLLMTSERFNVDGEDYCRHIYHYRRDRGVMTLYPLMASPFPRSTSGPRLWIIRRRRGPGVRARTVVVEHSNSAENSTLFSHHHPRSSQTVRVKSKLLRLFDVLHQPLENFRTALSSPSTIVRRFPKSFTGVDRPGAPKPNFITPSVFWIRWLKRHLDKDIVSSTTFYLNTVNDYLSEFYPYREKLIQFESRLIWDDKS